MSTALIRLYPELLRAQDAERRDLTVNALFYNLNTRLVEDCTGRGLADLKDGVLRTPQPPLDTFREGEHALLLSCLPSQLTQTPCGCS